MPAGDACWSKARATRFAIASASPPEETADSSDTSNGFALRLQHVATARDHSDGAPQLTTATRAPFANFMGTAEEGPAALLARTTAAMAVQRA